MGHGTEQDPQGAVDTDRAERLAATLHSAADPLRLRLLTALREGPQTATQLSAALDVEESKLVPDLDQLVDLGLVEQSDRAYALPDEHVAALLDEAVGHDRHEN